ncbi:MAG: ABC transporter permease [Chromatiaceae bacterium]|nr:ABC transporter permease [Chromatiaceae bacterium]MBP6582265.1 ABC transporter permease [Chromatiaceae bacterium]MBP8290441.1 ABC transporter permease [Chromatiaceae bacterium]
MSRPTPLSSQGFSGRRLLALVRKEGLQVVRDPSAILIAFVLPVILLFLFAYAVSLDIRQVPIGLVLESDDPSAQSLAAAFSGTRYFQVTPARDRRQVAGAVAAGELKGFVVIPADFAHRLAEPLAGPLVEIITDGSQPNNAGFVANYAEGVVLGWAQAAGLAPAPRVDLRPRFWFNPEIESRRFLVPGAIAIIMTMIGTLLTALVLAREWERGTLEALFSTQARVAEILVGKLLPYFGLGLLATLGSAALAIGVFGLPLQGSWGGLLLVSAVFLIPALGQGLVISAIAKNQFIAAQAALFTGFLPAFLLSGFLFEIDSMPAPIRAISLIVPARYFIASLQTVFLAGDTWSVLVPNMAAMLTIGAVFFALARLKTRKSLDA